jgi:hypothetical protein
MKPPAQTVQEATDELPICVLVTPSGHAVQRAAPAPE